MDKLDVILLIGRPAAGKSETIDFLKQLPDERRLQEYHIAPFEELDDFLYVWQTFEDDNIREHMGLPRRDTDANLYFLDDRIWDFFIERIDLDFRKKLARDPLFLETPYGHDGVRSRRRKRLRECLPAFVGRCAQSRHHPVHRRLIRGVPAQEPEALSPRTSRFHPVSFARGRQDGAILQGQRLGTSVRRA